MLDYLIVGSGLAGVCFSHKLNLEQKSFLLVGKRKVTSASEISAGIFNPIILKRFTPIWNISQMVKTYKFYYHSLEGLLNKKVLFDMPIYRVLNSVHEQNDWLIKSDQPILSEFLSSEISFLKDSIIHAPFGLGKVMSTGYLIIKELIDSYLNHLVMSHNFYDHLFNYNELKVLDNCVEYRGVKAKRLVFAEGFDNVNNPYFSYLPIDGTKGELITIYSESLKLNYIIKSNIFIQPLGGHFYKVGATYDWDDKSILTTETAKKTLINGLKKIVNVDFKFVSQQASIRPTVKDRRPIIGAHPNYKNVYIINGLGTRGVYLAPYLSERLYEYIEKDEVLDKELSIIRFNELCL